MFGFVMEMEGLDFKETLDLLARKAGIDLSQYSIGASSQNTKLKSRIYEANELAAKFYQVQFTKNKLALDYVIKTRQFKKEAILDFRLGYAPNTGNALQKYLFSKGFNLKELQQAGLVTRNYSSPGDMFRGGLMIPLADGQGRIIGFTARALGDENPKYINTPQSLVYDKSRHVYGLHLAKEAIRKSSFAVVAEGNLDVIASHQMGLKQVVATAGTALTEQHLKIIANLTSDVRLAFDQDKAGQAATERSIPIASKVGVNLSVIVIKEGKDPDELIKANPIAWQNAVNKPVYALDWLIASYKKQIDLSQAIGKRKFSDIVLPVVVKLADPVEQDHYISSLSELIGISKEALISKSQGLPVVRERLKVAKNQKPELDRDQTEQAKNQDQLLALGLINVKLRQYLMYITNEMLSGEVAPLLLDFLKNNPDYNSSPLAIEPLKKHLDYVKMLMLQYEALYQNLDEIELDYESKRLRDRLISRYVKQQKDELSFAMQKAGAEEVQRLLNQAKDLDNLLKLTREVANG